MSSLSVARSYQGYRVNIKKEGKERNNYFTLSLFEKVNLTKSKRPSF